MSWKLKIKMKGGKDLELCCTNKRVNAMSRKVRNRRDVIVFSYDRFWNGKSIATKCGLQKINMYIKYYGDKPMFCLSHKSPGIIFIVERRRRVVCWKSLRRAQSSLISTDRPLFLSLRIQWYIYVCVWERARTYLFIFVIDRTVSWPIGSLVWSGKRNKLWKHNNDRVFPKRFLRVLGNEKNHTFLYIPYTNAALSFAVPGRIGYWKGRRKKLCKDCALFCRQKSDQENELKGGRRQDAVDSTNPFSYPVSRDPRVTRDS